MSSPWKAYLKRSLEQIQQTTQTMVRADPTSSSSSGQVLAMHYLRSQEDLKQFATGCDADIGGKSQVNLDLGPDGKGRFWGYLSTELYQSRKRKGTTERSGYAGFRSKSRPSLFGNQFWDTTLHDYLKLRVKSSGDNMRYFVNIQTDGPISTDLYQHRLWLPESKSPNEQHDWTDVLIPFSDFTLTNSGEMAERHVKMMRERVRTVGISCLGPKEGRFELGIESIEAVVEDSSSR